MAGSPMVLMTSYNEHSMLLRASRATQAGKYDLGLSQLIHDKLCWLDVGDQVTIMVHRCLNGRAPQYLAV